MNDFVGGAAKRRMLGAFTTVIVGGIFCVVFGLACLLSLSRSAFRFRSFVVCRACLIPGSWDWIFLFLERPRNNGGPAKKAVLVPRCVTGFCYIAKQTSKCRLRVETKEEQAYVEFWLLFARV